MEASWVVMAKYMKEDEGFGSSELDEAGWSEADEDGTGKSSTNAFWNQEKESVSESEQGTTYSILSVFFFLSADDTPCTAFQVQNFDFCPLLCVDDIVVSLEET